MGRVRESMQTSNCARVSWNPQKDNQPQCLCFSSCHTVDGQSGWETYTYQAATTTDSDPTDEAGQQTSTFAEATSGSVASQDGSTAASTTTQASVAAAEAMEVGRCE